MDSTSAVDQSPPDTPATKSARTRELLADTALRMFREQGYEATTMRAIARAAGVSTGNAYYHFEGKDSLVQELYLRIQDEHRDRVHADALKGRTLAQNVRTVLHAGVEVMAPYHAFGSTLLASALRTDSPASPFSTSSADARTAAVGLMREVVSRSTHAPGGRVGERLPELLWLLYLGVTLFWVLDRSPGARRTALLIDGIAPLAGRLIALTRLPVGRRLAHEAVDLVDRIRAEPLTLEDASAPVAPAKDRPATADDPDAETADDPDAGGERE